jgi:5-methylcytosine-specific restriction endonuclease McrA
MTYYSKPMARLWPNRKHECHWCRRPLVWRKTNGQLRKDDATVDHLLPRERGGGSQSWNIVISCFPCNLARGSAGHCQAALACARAIFRANVKVGDVARFFHPARDDA